MNWFSRRPISSPIRRRKILSFEELEARVVLSSSVVPSLSALYHSTVQSTNWSGYASEVNFNSRRPDVGTVSAVSASWTVPAVLGGSPGSYSSFWVGIDGYSSGTVEQIGTDSDVDSGGNPVYYAWYEMYPSPFKTISSLNVKPGDVISASVTSDSSNNFTLNIADGGQGGGSGSFSITLSSPRAQRSSAEWVAEAPSSQFGVLPLTNFGTVTFTNATATIKGRSGPIDFSGTGGWQDNAINMITSSGALKATTGPLTDSGANTSNTTTSSFSVAWNSSGFNGTLNTQPPTHHSSNDPALDLATLIGIPANPQLGGTLSFVPPAQVFTPADIPQFVPTVPNPAAAQIGLRGPLVSCAESSPSGLDPVPDDIFEFVSSNSESHGPSHLSPRIDRAGTREFVGTPAVLAGNFTETGEAVLPVAVPTAATEEGETRTGGGLSKAIWNAVWLAGAVAFFAQSAYLSRPSPLTAEDERERTSV